MEHRILLQLDLPFFRVKVNLLQKLLLNRVYGQGNVATTHCRDGFCAVSLMLRVNEIHNATRGENDGKTLYVIISKRVDRTKIVKKKVRSKIKIEIHFIFE